MWKGEKMGSLMMHLTSLYRLKKKYNYTDDFIIGGIAPDIIKRAIGRDDSHFIEFKHFPNGEIRKLPSVNNYLSSINRKFDD